MPILKKAQPFQQKVLHFGGGPALLFLQPGLQFRLMPAECLVPAEKIVRAVQGTERVEQVFHILRGLGGGHHGVRVKGRLLAAGKVVHCFLIRRRTCPILARIHLRLGHRLMGGVGLGQQLVQGGLGRQIRGRSAARQQAGRQDQGTAFYESVHIAFLLFDVGAGKKPVRSQYSTAAGPLTSEIQ